jgi:hypothetical protein
MMPEPMLTGDEMRLLERVAMVESQLAVVRGLYRFGLQPQSNGRTETNEPAKQECSATAR